MSAEKSHEWLIDALYEERDEQPDSPTPDDARASLEREQRELLASYDAMLSELREGMVMHTPRSEVSDSIRAAARKQAEVYAAAHIEAGGKPARRAPSSSSASHQSFWSKARRQGVLQLVAVLAVCLGAGLLVRTMNFTSSDEAPAMQSEVAAAAPEAVPSGDNAPFMDGEAPPEEASREVASKGDSKGDFEDYDYSSRQQELQPDNKAKDIALALKETRKPLEEGLDNVRGQDRTRTNKKRVKSKPSRREATKSSSASLADELWGSGSSERDKKKDSPKLEPSPVTEPSSPSSVFGGEEDIAQEKQMARAPARSGRGSVVGNVASAPGTPTDTGPQPQKPAEEFDYSVTQEEGVASGAPLDHYENESAEQKPASPVTLDDAERSYRKNDYEQTLTDADAYLARGIGTNKQRARAMELKAQALGKLGRGAEAQGIYEEIRETYPDYYRKENLKSKKKQRKAAPKKKMETDFSDDSLFQSF